MIVSGATGAYGSAAALVALAMGASRVIAVGRNAQALESVAKLGGGRVVTMTATGDVAADAQAIRTAADGGAHIAFDMVGNARDPNLTLAALRGLAQGGRLVLMGSMTVPLVFSYSDIMRNNWEIILRNPNNPLRSCPTSGRSVSPPTKEYSFGVQPLELR